MCDFTNRHIVTRSNLKGGNLIVRPIRLPNNSAWAGVRVHQTEDYPPSRKFWGSFHSGKVGGQDSQIYQRTNRQYSPCISSHEIILSGRKSINDNYSDRVFFASIFFRFFHPTTTQRENGGNCGNGLSLGRAYLALWAGVRRGRGRARRSEFRDKREARKMA